MVAHARAQAIDFLGDQSRVSYELESDSNLDANRQSVLVTRAKRPVSYCLSLSHRNFWERMRIGEALESLNLNQGGLNVMKIGRSNAKR